MATTPTKPGSRKILLVAGAVALLLVGYLYYKSRGSSSTPAASPSGAQASPLPQTGSSGNTQSSNDQQATADLLAALSGENQSLTKSFLDSVNGLVSLAGSSVGSPSSTAGAPSGFSSGAAAFASTTSSPTTITSSPSGDVTATGPGYIAAFSPGETATQVAAGGGAGLPPSEQAAIVSSLSQYTISSGAGSIAPAPTPVAPQNYYSKMTYSQLAPSAVHPNAPAAGTFQSATGPQAVSKAAQVKVKSL